MINGTFVYGLLDTYILTYIHKYLGSALSHGLIAQWGGLDDKGKAITTMHRAGPVTYIHTYIHINDDATYLHNLDFHDHHHTYLPTYLHSLDFHDRHRIYLPTYLPTDDASG